MRQQHRGKPTIILWLVLFKPRNLRRCKTRQHGVANTADGFFKTAKFLGDGFTLGGCGCITPELGRTDDLSFFIKRHKSVLLPANPDTFQFRRACFGLFERSLNAGGRGFFPGFRVLLLCSRGQALNEPVSTLTTAEHLTTLSIHH